MGGLAWVLAGCGASESEAPAASVQGGIDRSVSDVRAAEAAMAAPIAQSKSVAELTKPRAEAEVKDGTAKGADKG